MTDLDRLGIHMVARPLAVPTIDLPPGFTLVHLPGPALRDAWCALTSRCDLLDTPERAREEFDRDFAPRLSDFSDRCLFLRDEQNSCLIGTATAWFSRPDWPDYGMVHWVGLLPEYRGRSLSMPLLARVLGLLARHHHQAYLSTQGFRLPAIRQYLRLGFRPCYTTAESMEAWQAVGRHITHPGLQHPLAGCTPATPRRDDAP